MTAGAVKNSLVIRKKEECKWDLVSLGEVMLRLDPGDVRVATTRQFNVWEGGGEYNVARGLRRCFGLKTAIVTALADNRPNDAQWPELYGAWIWCARCVGMLGPWQYGGEPIEAGSD
jgi:hypothetical protein